MSLVCSVIFIHHAFNANILDKDYAFSDGEILMVDNAVRTHFEPYERHFKEIGFTENTIKKYLQYPDSDGACSCEVFTCFKCTDWIA